MTDQQSHRDRAARWIARHLEGRLLPGIDAHLVAAHVIDTLVAEHWRCIPPAPAVAAKHKTDPDTALATTKRGADFARELLAKTRQEAP